MKSNSKVTSAGTTADAVEASFAATAGLQLPDKQLRGTFIVAVPDDALSPFTPRGMRLVFDPGLKPEPGQGVLIEDAAGNRYVRRYVQGSGGRWTAGANNPHFHPLDSIAHGLRILAVSIWRGDGSA
jgi:hypothetical protein